MLMRPPSLPRFDTAHVAHGARTWAELGLRDFAAFWRALRRSACPLAVTEIVDAMFAGWGDQPIAADPRWRSQISDDGTPWELSVAYAGGTVQPRLIVEAQGREPTWASNVAAGLDLTARLIPWGAEVDALERIRELFLPRDGDGTFGLWHGVGFGDGAPAAAAGGKPLFKVYLNPQIHGRYHASAVVEQAFAALGLRSAFASVLEASHRGHDVDEIRYFSIDLDRSAAARVKVYFAHEHATADELERVFALATDTAPGRARALCRTIGGGDGPFDDLPVSTCLSFVAGRDRPTSVTAHFPVRAYVRDDVEARDRIEELLGECGIDTGRYREAVDAVAHRALGAGVGLQSYASLKASAAPSCTIYVGSEACRVACPRPPEGRGAASIEPQPAAEIIAFADAIDLRNHPFFRRLEQTDDVVNAMHRLALNMRAGIAHRFTQWLAGLIARVPDVAVRSILAHQLDDELGHGHPEQAHVHMFERMFAAVEAEATPLSADVDALAPARRFAAAVEPMFLSDDPWAGVGMAALTEVLASQTDAVIARVFRRQQSVPHSALGWAFLHDELEQSHAQDSASIMAYVPDDPAVHAAMWRGARVGAIALWVLLDELYPLCFDRVCFDR